MCDKTYDQCTIVENRLEEYYNKDNCNHNWILVDEMTYYPTMRKHYRCEICGADEIRYYNM